MRLIKTAIKEELKHLGIKYEKPKNQGGKMSLAIYLEKHYEIILDNSGKYLLLKNRKTGEITKLLIEEEKTNEKKSF